MSKQICDDRRHWNIKVEYEEWKCPMCILMDEFDKLEGEAHTIESELDDLQDRYDELDYELDELKNDYKILQKSKDDQFKQLEECLIENYNLKTSSSVVKKSKSKVTQEIVEELNIFS